MPYFYTDQVSRPVPLPSPSNINRTRPLSVNQKVKTPQRHKLSAMQFQNFDPFSQPMDDRQWTEAGPVAGFRKRGICMEQPEVETVHRQQLYCKLATPLYAPSEFVNTIKPSESQNILQRKKEASSFRKQEIRKNVNTKYILQIVDTDRGYRSPELLSKENRIRKIREARLRE